MTSNERTPRNPGNIKVSLDVGDFLPDAIRFPTGSSFLRASFSDTRTLREARPQAGDHRLTSIDRGTTSPRTAQRCQRKLGVTMQ